MPWSLQQGGNHTPQTILCPEAQYVTVIILRINTDITTTQGITTNFTVFTSPVMTTLLITPQPQLG